LRLPRSAPPCRVPHQHCAARSLDTIPITPGPCCGSYRLRGPCPALPLYSRKNLLSRINGSLFCHADLTALDTLSLIAGFGCARGICFQAAFRATAYHLCVMRWGPKTFANIANLPKLVWPTKVFRAAGLVAVLVLSWPISPAFSQGNPPIGQGSQPAASQNLWNDVLKPFAPGIGGAIVALLGAWFVTLGLTAQWEARKKRAELDIALARDFYKLVASFKAIAREGGGRARPARCSRLCGRARYRAIRRRRARLTNRCAPGAPPATPGGLPKSAEPRR
jgi:hypothetical protein